MSVSIRGLALIAALVALGPLAGCDLPGDPVPTNPYDPLFDGPRIATSPTDLMLVDGAASAVTFSWTDQSSFETGFAVRVRTGTGTGFSTIATLPPNTTTYTDAGLQSTADRSYQVVALLDSGRNGAPSEPLDLRFIREQTVLSALEEAAPGVTDAVFSDGGGVLYARTPDAVWAADARSGAVLGSLGAATEIANVTGGERIAVVAPAEGRAVTVLTYARASLQSTARLAPGGACAGVALRAVRVSADGQTIAALCDDASGSASVLGVWGAQGGAPRRTVALPATRGVLVRLSPDGTRAVVSSALAAGGRTLIGVDAAAGTVLWTETSTDGADFDLAFSPDGGRIFDGTPRRLRLRSAATGEVVVSTEGASSRPSQPSFAPGGMWLGVVFADQGRVSILGAAALDETFELAPGRVQGLRLLGASQAVVFVNRSGGGARYLVERYDTAAGWEVAQARDAARPLARR